MTAHARARIAYAATCGLIVSGCALFFSDLDDSYTGGAEPDAGDAATLDGSPTDVSTPPIIDGGFDVVVRRCDSDAYAFCADFDTSTEFAPSRFVPNSKPPGSLLIEPGVATSAPNALHATMPRLEFDYPDSDNRARVDLPHAWGKAHVELDLRVEAPAWKAGDSTTDIGSFSWTSSTNSVQVYLVLAPSGFGISYAANDPRGPFLPYGKWTRLSIDFSPTSFAMRYEGSTVSRMLTPPDAGASQGFRVSLGQSVINTPVPAVDVRYDDVTVAFPP